MLLCLSVRSEHICFLLFLKKILLSKINRATFWISRYTSRLSPPGLLIKQRSSHPHHSQLHTRFNFFSTNRRFFFAVCYFFNKFFIRDVFICSMKNTKAYVLQ